ncbi:cyclic-di-AMP receptor [Lacticaseibacillus pabuli]|uniref:Cyclic-di-AMP receptor n=1 Tax=Lacticaseibacillus pabuli TaxID=3025672 RepID=A0ABY7WU97_9LACO|nr:cyclic-di-AMP receptor [Lacticaseibacillus sp. KACC 23028]WDF83344.1 cyclic-di-AMP receptor [Lacticaseibacillus sp. KACC 23028]
MTKVIMAIVQDKDASLLSSAFIDANVRATKLSTTGGFLRSGNSTFIIGIDDERVDEVLKIIKDNCQSREEFTSTPTIAIDAAAGDAGAGAPIEVTVGGATVFVLPVDAFYRY